MIGPRATRPDGRKPFIPDYTDNKTPRPNRYSMLDSSSVLPVSATQITGDGLLISAVWNCAVK